MKTRFVVSLFLAALAATPAWAAGIKPVETDIPAGTYTLDKTHASLIFRVSHLGFSMYTARFTRFDATLDLDPDEPESASLTARVDAASIETDFPLEEPDFNAQLQNEKWLHTAQHPDITFQSTDIEMTGPDTAKVTGDFTLRGVTKPLTLDVTFNGGYAENEWDPSGSRTGFSATGALSRSAFGMTYGIPEEGSDFGVGDRVEIVLETEFVKPEEGGPQE